MTDKDEQKDTELEVNTDPGDDIVLEDNTEVTGADYKVKVDKLKAKIKELEKKNHELLDGWQRDKADFINTRKRDDEAKKQFLKFSKAEIISELIPVLDSFDGAFKNKEAWGKVDKNWRMGVEFIHTQLSNILSQHDLKVINPIGLPYISSRDEAIENIKVDNEADEGKILEVVQVGYELNGKEIRPPKVKVGHYE
ncbi:MAG: nucleotide exchange factor GrpE [Candidatus Zambryskibacteria bacterium RIFCSPLOWO2_02_FULL_39_26]|uniref:Protein GrpE n=1 Tax=Candidatus Zambryskibacteria bacterium RIFCSPLOWO2_12_FULL_39_23 TaxID=1802776 RepID=A0A1G2UTQ5_9BACT|nr:MAG: nucleotide exchange factor GrpE [Candidatus Zambryskibacteria bacterium RIFCSPHIGHO2_02_39_10]OHA99379.1 MAG: nucleotide exchange factor GrpE [Candidatus Zambryskibacteria bacterium RIFCSPHIGHO2_12_FULL_39_47]OHB10369.1 MAG: nucleotide exchange factor GrpE [Candidatus Zambryskibacteria bacterium RIFCSPLOWO2_02_FULL_39_26]OHB12746.1 MAG: nucleotide exchange factor GrpE [Candidatus Zambryskibacteria bacterium RIFCSPLOWO2_12_FULL_39_23]